MKPLRIIFATSRRRLRPAAFIGALCLLTSASLSVAGAAVYRWVDDQGKVHYAEVVPQRYQGVAKQVGAAANEPSAERRRDALARSQQEKARAAERHRTLANIPSAANAVSAAAASAPAGKRRSRLNRIWLLRTIRRFAPSARQTTVRTRIANELAGLGHLATSLPANPRTAETARKECVATTTTADAALPMHPRQNLHSRTGHRIARHVRCYRSTVSIGQERRD